MLNRDVKITIAITAIFIIVTLRIPAFPRANTGTSYKNSTATSSSRNDSYENYLSKRKRDNKSLSRLYYTPESVIIHVISNKAIKNEAQSFQKNKILKYKVRRGDTITKISKIYNVPSGQIISLNNISEKGLKTGYILKIPTKTKLSAYSSKKTPAQKHLPISVKSFFRWPLDHVDNYKSDGDNGVKPIGILISGKPGSVVVSAAPGTVKKIGHMRGYGKYIVINHTGRFATVYANLSQISVNEGEKIHAGNKIGNIPGNDKKLHFQIDYEGKPEDPLKFLPKKINM